MKVHFSIDDVGNTLRWCAFNCPESIFDMNFFGDLKRWHKDYGLKVTLYCFFDNGSDFCMEDLPDRYLEELRNQCGWLRMAYHGSPDEKAGWDVFSEEKRRFDEMIGAELSASIVRLHCWRAPKGVSLSCDKKSVFLCPDYERLPYDLTSEEWEKLKTVRTLYKENREYWLTDLRYDHIDSVEQLDPYLGKERLVIFGHEWMYKEKRKLIIEMLKKLEGADYLV